MHDSWQQFLPSDRQTAALWPRSVLKGLAPGVGQTCLSVNAVLIKVLMYQAAHSLMRRHNRWEVLLEGLKHWPDGFGGSLAYNIDTTDGILLLQHLLYASAPMDIVRRVLETVNQRNKQLEISTHLWFFPPALTALGGSAWTSTRGELRKCRLPDVLTLAVQQGRHELVQLVSWSAGRVEVLLRPAFCWYTKRSGRCQIVTIDMSPTQTVHTGCCNLRPAAYVPQQYAVECVFGIGGQQSHPDALSQPVRPVHVIVT